MGREIKEGWLFYTRDEGGFARDVHCEDGDRDCKPGEFKAYTATGDWNKNDLHTSEARVKAEQARADAAKPWLADLKAMESRIMEYLHAHLESQANSGK